LWARLIDEVFGGCDLGCGEDVAAVRSLLTKCERLRVGSAAHQHSMFVADCCENAVLVLPGEVVAKQESLLAGALWLDGCILENGGEFSVDFLCNAKIITRLRLDGKDCGIDEQGEGIRHGDLLLCE